MKKKLILSVFVLFMLLGSQTVMAQEKDEKTTPEKANVTTEEEEGPTMFKFEPDFLTTSEQRKERIKEARRMLDTMDISDRRRRKLLKDLHKNGITERLSKTLYADNKFEDIKE